MSKPQKLASGGGRGRGNRATPIADLILLFFLYEDRPLCGYALKQLVKETHLERWLPISPMTVYQSLRRLTEDGYVVGASEKPGRYPQRTSYTITPKGRRHFITLIRKEMGTFMRDTLHSDVGVGMGNYLSLAEKRAAVNERMEQLLARRHEVEDELNNYGRGVRSPFPRWLLLDHERHMLDAELAWLKRFLDFAIADEEKFGDWRAQLRGKAEA